MAQVYFFLLVFLTAILLHYMMVLEHFSTSTPTATTATTTPTAPPTATAPATAPPTATPTAPATVPTNRFSEMISTLVTYVPGKDNKALTSAVYDPVAANTNAMMGSGSNAYLDQIRGVVKDELAVQLKDIKLGPKDVQNNTLANRNVATVSVAQPPANSDSLVQGQDFRTASSCPYASSQQPSNAQPYPIDMNDYVRKDSIPCWGCNLK